MRLKAIVIAAAGVLLGILVAAVLALRSVDFNKGKILIAEQAKAATGRRW